MIGTHSRSGYNRGCRCGVCVEANRAHQRELRQRYKGLEPPSHGTNYAYVAYSCRCEFCRSANTLRSREYYRRRKATS